MTSVGSAGASPLTTRKLNSCCATLKARGYSRARTLRGLSLVTTRYAVPVGARPSERIPRSIRAFACARSEAARLIAGRIPNLSYGRAVEALKYGLSRVGLHPGLQYSSSFAPKVNAEVIDMHPTRYGRAQVSA